MTAAQREEEWLAMIDAKLFEAFVAGFQESGEGWNGEYPFDDRGIDIAADDDIKAAFREWRGVAS